MGLFDIKCEACGHFTDNEYYGPDEEPEPCPACGGKQTKAWFTPGTVIHDGSFRPFKLTEDGRTFETKAQWDAYVAQKTRQAGCEVDFEGFNPAKQRAIADDIRHEAWKNRKAAGRA
jgi:hypothetical protein